jgi:ubiquinone/menaquinone biosynthesis C-methylase UbiE
MNRAATFDALAEAYDSSFVESLTGQAQRRMTHKWLQPVWAGRTGLHILEINCGTGTDAMWLAEQGHIVTATDASAAMINQAQQKAMVTSQLHQLRFQKCAFDELHTVFDGQQFDCIFSNFAGLNCVLPEDMRSLAKHLYSLLRPGGYLAVVLFGKYCAWEICYYLLKAQPKQAFRRWTNKQVMVPLTPAIQQPVYYYSTKHLVRLLAPLQLVYKKPVGLFIPPSWAEGLMQQHPRLYRSLRQLEHSLGGASLFSELADHSFILLKKEAS